MTLLKNYNSSNDQVLAYCEFGDPRGFPILVQHGLIASIQDASLFERWIAHGARLICIARPGYGQSSPYPLRNIGEWGELVAGLVAHLGLDQFDILGISSGAPYNYAIAHRLPTKARRVFILSGTPALFDQQVRSLWPFPLDPYASLAELQQLAFDLFFAHLPPEALATLDIQDTMMNNCFGIALDFKLRAVDWGFALAQIEQQVIMRHSRADESVPFGCAELTANLLPNCTLDIRENDEHFSQAVLDDFMQTVMAKDESKIAAA
jgi:pimeloyl-ACP methyl ester carboxylesterase